MTMEHDSQKERRALGVVRVAGTGVLVIGIAVTLALPSKPVHRNVPGFLTPIVGFELASEPGDVIGILGEPGTPEHAAVTRRMDRGNRIDFLFAVAYPGLYVGLAMLLTARGRLPAAAGVVLSVLAGVMTVGDWLENRQLFALSAAPDAEAMLGPLERLRPLTLAKWYALYAASGLVAIGIWRERGPWRWSAIAYAGAALLGLLSLAFPPAIEYGSLLLMVAWVVTYVHAIRSRGSFVPGSPPETPAEPARR